MHGKGVLLHLDLKTFLIKLRRAPRKHGSVLRSRRQTDSPAPSPPTMFSAAMCAALRPAPPPLWRRGWPSERRATGRKPRCIEVIHGDRDAYDPDAESQKLRLELRIGRPYLQEVSLVKQDIDPAHFLLIVIVAKGRILPKQFGQIQYPFPQLREYRRSLLIAALSHICFVTVLRYSHSTKKYRIIK